MSISALLDTPRKISLQNQADIIRATLKEFERSFFAEHGKKPGKTDIKTNQDIDKKYKEYHKLSDVLAGKLRVAALEEGQASPKGKRHDRPKDEVRKRRKVVGTPRKTRVVSGDEDEAAGIEEEEANQLAGITSIGPTPQRDGKVMGLFDMMSPASAQSIGTPSSKKRTIDVLARVDQGTEALVAATPEQKRQKLDGDVLQHLSGGTPHTARAKHSRTPISEGKKFMLSQFFATPSAVRYSHMGGTPQKNNDETGKTPLKAHVLGVTPATQRLVAEDKDKTPNYLKRTHSFKDRLLASNSVPGSRSTLDAPPSPASSAMVNIKGAVGSRGRFQPKLLSQIAAELRQRDVQERYAEDEEDEDEMDALREMEDGEMNIVMVHNGDEQPTRTYKKKGQKRTTKRVIMRPVAKPKIKKATAKSVPENYESGGDENADDSVSVVEETQYRGPSTQAGDGNHWSDDDELFQALVADEDAAANPTRAKATSDNEFEDTATLKKKHRAKTKANKKEKPLGRAPTAKKTAIDDEDEDEDTRTYNPNTTSHMNFKTLKIKSKNSKGKFKGGRGGRFGGRRR